MMPSDGGSRVAVGLTSSRKLEKATYQDAAFRVLAAGEPPHFTSLNEFRAKHRQALGNLFHQILRELHVSGTCQTRHVAIDGTKMKANASKHKAMSYERMEQEDARLTAEGSRRRSRRVLHRSDEDVIAAMTHSR